MWELLSSLEGYYETFGFWVLMRSRALCPTLHPQIELWNINQSTTAYIRLLSDN